MFACFILELVLLLIDSVFTDVVMLVVLKDALKRWHERQQRRLAPQAQQPLPAQLPGPTLAEVFLQLDMIDFLPAFQKEKYLLSDLPHLSERELTAVVPLAGPRGRLQRWIASNSNADHEQRGIANMPSAPAAPGGVPAHALASCAPE